MSVIIGSARIDERGRATGGRAGDQTGREVSTQNYYRHSKGWRILRARDSGAAEKIAQAMERACANNNIGYDQYSRNSLYKYAKPREFDPGKVTEKCETDCSALVRVCCAYAGIMVDDFNTSSQASRLLRSGAFVELKSSKYTNQDDYLRRGDVLVTRSKGHTVVVLSDGDKAENTPAPEKPPMLGERILRNGDSGKDVAQLQEYLIQLGYDCGRWGADGDFGDATELAVMVFQHDSGILKDGEAGPDTYKVLKERLNAGGDGVPKDARTVRIRGGNCFVRIAPNTQGKKLGVARCGDKLPYGGTQSVDGWLLVEFKGQNAWVSGKYGVLEE